MSTDRGTHAADGKPFTSTQTGRPGLHGLRHATTGAGETAGYRGVPRYNESQMSSARESRPDPEDPGPRPASDPLDSYLGWSSVRGPHRPPPTGTGVLGTGSSVRLGTQGVPRGPLGLPRGVGSRTGPRIPISLDDPPEVVSVWTQILRPDRVPLWKNTTAGTHSSTLQTSSVPEPASPRRVRSPRHPCRAPGVADGPSPRRDGNPTDDNSSTPYTSNYSCCLTPDGETSPTDPARVPTTRHPTPALDHPNRD